MRAFSQLLDDPSTRSRNAKLRLIGVTQGNAGPDRGLALAALTGTLDIKAVKPAQIRAMAMERIDPVLLAMSRDYVGDMAETLSCSGRSPRCEPPDLDDGTVRLSERSNALKLHGRMDAPGNWEDARPSRHLAASFAAIVAGALRVGISARRQAGLADASGRRRGGGGSLAWLKPLMPSCRLGRGAWAPAVGQDVPLFRPFMLAQPLEELRVSLDDYAAEWKWDGIRVQIAHAGGETRLYSRTGDDISKSFRKSPRPLRRAGGRRRAAGPRRGAGRR